MDRLPVMLFFFSFCRCLFLSCLDVLQVNISKRLWNEVLEYMSDFCTNLLSAFRAQGVPLAGGNNWLVMPSLIGHWFIITIIFIGFLLINQQGQ